MGKLVVYGNECSGTNNTASNISYNNQTSGLGATNAQQAIDETVSMVLEHTIIKRSTLSNISINAGQSYLQIPTGSCACFTPPDEGYEISSIFVDCAHATTMFGTVSKESIGGDGYLYVPMLAQIAYTEQFLRIQVNWIRTS